MMSALLAAGTSPITGIVGIIGGALAIIAIIGVALAYTRANYAKATIETLRDSNQALSERVKINEEDLEKCRTRQDALDSENKQLRTYVSGTEAIDKLADTLGRQHNEVMDAFRDIVANLAAAHITAANAPKTRRAPAKSTTTRGRATR